MANNKSIQILRGNNSQILAAQANEQDIDKLLPGQPLYNMDKHYLIIGSNENNAYTQDPIVCKQLVGYDGLSQFSYVNAGGDLQAYSETNMNLFAMSDIDITSAGSVLNLYGEMEANLTSKGTINIKSTAGYSNLGINIAVTESQQDFGCINIDKNGISINVNSYMGNININTPINKLSLFGAVESGNGASYTLTAGNFWLNAPIVARKNISVKDSNSSGGNTTTITPYGLNFIYSGSSTNSIYANWSFPNKSGNFEFCPIYQTEKTFNSNFPSALGGHSINYNADKQIGLSLPISDIPISSTFQDISIIINCYTNLTTYIGQIKCAGSSWSTSNQIRFRSRDNSSWVSAAGEPLYTFYASYPAIYKYEFNPKLKYNGITSTANFKLETTSGNLINRMELVDCNNAGFAASFYSVKFNYLNIDCEYLYNKILQIEANM